MRYGSVCSGIEAATVAWQPLGWEARWFSEIEPFPCAVLDTYYNVTNHGDMEAMLDGRTLADIDVLVGGTPCQSFSVAGLRNGLNDARGNLALVFCELARRLRPRWVVWENVPGVLSTDGGRGFGAIVGALHECGYGVCWRVLNAQYFGVPQRRRRVFLVGYLGDWRRAAAVLFEPDSLRRNPTSRPPSIAGTLTASVAKRRGSGQQPEKGDSAPLVFDPTQVTHPEYRSKDFTKAPNLAESGHVPVAFNIYPEAGQGAELRASSTDQANAITQQSQAGKNERGTRLVETAGIRRLTPTECERLQGFPERREDAIVTVCETQLARQYGGAVMRAGNPLSSNPIVTGELAVARVLIDCERREAVLHNAENCGIAASIAASPSRLALADETVASALGLVDTLGTLAKTTRHGLAASRPNTTRFTLRSNGTLCASLSGNEIAALADSATSDPITEQFITLTGGQITREEGLTLITSYCSVVHAIVGFIRETIARESFCIDLQLRAGYTLIEWNGKPASDTVRYKALGNSMAVPVMAWLGRRIDFVDKLGN